MTCFLICISFLVFEEVPVYFISSLAAYADMKFDATDCRFFFTMSILGEGELFDFSIIFSWSMLVTWSIFVILLYFYLKLKAAAKLDFLVLKEVD